MNILLKTVIVIFLFLVFPVKIYAYSIVVSGLSETIDQSAETQVDVVLTCSGCGDSYLRGVFYPGNTNYFGFTQNNTGDWIGLDSDRTKYFKVAKTDLTDASWSGKIKIKPDTSDQSYTGPGEYLFKIGRYTSGTDASADWSNELAIKITGPTPTPSPTAVPTQAPSPTPTLTPVKTPTPTPTPVKTLKPTPGSTLTPTPQVLGADVTETAKPTPYPSPDKKESPEKNNSFPLVLSITFVSAGLILIGFTGYSIYKKTKRSSGIES